jgi:transmembrane sensor
MRFDDGSTATPLDASSTLEAVESSRGRVVLRVPRGGAKFEVVHDPSRVFRVELGSVIVEDRGTSFTVERVTPQDGDRVRVSVEQGRVRVSWPSGTAEVSAGESGVFPDVAKSSPAQPPLKTAPQPAWRQLADRGDFRSAYQALQHQEPTAIRDDIADLLLAADVARRSHHASEAVAPLRKVMRDHRSEERAPLASFTLGRILLDELGEPLDAAEAFAEAHVLAPEGPLASDALAREIEARYRAGQLDAAKRLAEQYVRLYPDGTRLRSVRRFGHLE